jgi:DoxX-like family
MTMTTAYVTTTLIAVAANGFSGVAALLHFRPILAGMANADVPESWLTFPIGTLKTLGALGLAAGLAFPALGISAAIGLVLVLRVRGLYPHSGRRLRAAVRARDRLPDS